jgi:hypothetical protein
VVCLAANDSQPIIEEEFHMKKHKAFQSGIFALAVLLGLLSTAAVARASNPAVIGDWQGMLDTGTGSLRLVVHIAQGQDGNLTATMDSLDQGATAIAVSTINFKQPDLHFEIARIGGSFDGKINPASTEVVGNWKQGGASLPLTLKRARK